MPLRRASVTSPSSSTFSSLVAITPPFLRLDGSHVRCLRALLPLAHLELDGRPFGERLEAVALDARVVHERILAALCGRDEAVALRIVEPLYGSGCHKKSPPLPRYERARRRKANRTRSRYREKCSSGRGRPVPRLRPDGRRPLDGPAMERVHDRLEPPALVGQVVLDPRRTRVDDGALEDARVLELHEARGQRPRRDGAEHLAELVETEGPGVGRVDDREEPAPLEEVGRAANLLGQRHTLTTARHPSRAPARTRT